MDPFTSTVGVFAQMSPDLLQVVSWLILASRDDEPNLRHDMKWGILMSGGVYILVI